MFANCSRIDSRTNGLREQQVVRGELANTCSQRVRELFATVRELIPEQISETQTPEISRHIHSGRWILSTNYQYPPHAKQRKPQRDRDEARKVERQPTMDQLFREPSER